MDGQQAEKTRQQTGCVSLRKCPKTVQKGMRSPLLAPFQAGRATVASDIIVRTASDDLRQAGAATAHEMSVYVWSAFST